MTVLPESFLKCLSKEDRASLGKGGLTWEEALRRGQVKNERDLQSKIVNLLRLKGIEPLWHRTDKRSAATVGWPDITFAIRKSIFAPFATTRFPKGKIEMNDDCPCAWEIKFGNGQLSKEQLQMHVRLSTPPNSWKISVIRSVDEALAELKELGL